jgi:hypothetical protein
VCAQQGPDNHVAEHRAAGRFGGGRFHRGGEANRDTLLSFAADFDGLAAEAECAQQAQPKETT